MADLTTQVLLDFGITGNNAVAAGIKKLVASQKKLANETLESEKVNKSFSLSLVKAKLKLSDLGKSLKDAGIASKDWDEALGGNEAKIIAVQHQLGKLERTTKADIAAKKKQKDATKKAKDQLAVLELKLKEHGLTLKQAAGHTRKLTAARRGDAGAMKIVTTATNQAIRANKKQTSSLMEQLFGVRNLRNANGELNISFSTLRSKLLLAAFAFGMVSRTIGKFVKAAGDAEEITNKFNTVFGQSSDEALEFARSIGQRAETELKSFLSTIQDTLVPLGFMRDMAAELSQATVQLALDVASFNNKMDADVIRDFQSAMVGNHETVKKYGIILNQGRVELEAFRLGLTDANGNIDEQDKALARLNLIMKSSVDAHGDLSKTQDEFNNQLKALGATSQQSMEAIGSALKPVITLFIKFANVALNPALIMPFVAALSILATHFVIVAVKARLATAATKGFNLALAKSPWGLAIIAITTLIGTYIHLATEQDNATESTKNAAEELNRLTLEKVKLNQLSLEEKIKLEQEAISKSNKTIKENTSLIDDNMDGLFEISSLYNENTLEKLNNVDAMVLENEKQKSNIETKEKNIEALKEEIKIREFIAQQEFNKAVDEVSTSYENQLALLLATNDTERALIKVTQTLGIAYDEIPQKIRDQVVEYEKLKEILKEVGELEVTLGIRRAEGVDTTVKTVETEKGLGDTRRDLFIETLASAQTFLENKQEELDVIAQIGSQVIDQHNTKIQAIQSEARSELESLRQKDSYKNASDRRKAAMEDKIRQKHSGALADEFKSKKDMQKALAIMSGARAFVEALPNYVLAGLTAVSTAMQVSAINAQPAPQAFAKGGDFITNRPELIQVGEAGRERVTITPVDRPESRALGSMGGNVNINFSGNVLSQDFIEDEAIPMIKEALRRGGDLDHRHYGGGQFGESSTPFWD